MTTYHRYILANGKSTNLDQLRAIVREASGIEFDREIVLHDGHECGILIDVTRRGDPIFDADLLVIKDRLTLSGASDSHTQQVLNAAQCMVTVQVTYNADESVLETIWRTLRSYRAGVLVMEGCASAIRYGE